MPVSIIILLLSFSMVIIISIYFRMEHIKSKKAHKIRIHKYLIDFELHNYQIQKREINLNRYNFLSYNLKEVLQEQNIQ